MGPTDCSSRCWKRRTGNVMSSSKSTNAKRGHHTAIDTYIHVTLLGLYNLRWVMNYALAYTYCNKTPPQLQLYMLLNSNWGIYDYEWSYLKKLYTSNLMNHWPLIYLEDKWKTIITFFAFYEFCITSCFAKRRLLVSDTKLSKKLLISMTVT